MSQGPGLLLSVQTEAEWPLISDLWGKMYFLPSEMTPKRESSPNRSLVVEAGGLPRTPAWLQPAPGRGSWSGPDLTLSRTVGAHAGVGFGACPHWLLPQGLGCSGGVGVGPASPAPGLCRKGSAAALLVGTRHSLLEPPGARAPHFSLTRGDLCEAWHPVEQTAVSQDLPIRDLLPGLSPHTALSPAFCSGCRCGHGSSLP